MGVTYLHLPAGAALPTFDAPRPFRLVIVLEQPTGPLWRDEICGGLLRAECLYLMTWGQDCEAWHHSADEAHLRAWDFADVPEENSILTTWHEGESLAETFWFAHRCAFHPLVPLPDALIVHIAPEPRSEGLLTLWAKTLEADLPENAL